MANTVDDHQKRIFYTNEWSPEVEQRFVNGLRREAVAANYREGSVINGNAIRRVLTEINFCFNTRFDYKFCYDQTRRLRQRYEAFTRIIGTNGVVWSESDNRMQCDPCIWDEISKTERLALAYRAHGEIHYAAMLIIFKVEDGSGVFNQLHPVTDLSSSLNSMSIIPSQVHPIQESPYPDIKIEFGGDGSSCSDVGTPI